jgi:excisionase family DNA binding protein
MSKTDKNPTAVVPEALRNPTCSVEEAAPLLGLSRGLAYKAARAGELPVMKFGRRFRVITAALRRQLGMEVA